VERIINAGMQLFMEKGFDKTSMYDIVEVSDMSKGAIFYHFKTKEEIFEAAMERRYEQVTKTMLDWLAELDGFNAKEKLVALVNKNVDDNDLACENENMMKIGMASPHLVLAHIKRNVAKAAPIMAEIIREGIADGSIVTDYPDEAAELFLHLINYWCDPLTFECDLPAVRKRLECLQHIMRSLGVDIMTDELIEVSMRMTENVFGAFLRQKYSEKSEEI
jgi:AcrR family transcriptional regulator